MNAAHIGYRHRQQYECSGQIYCQWKVGGAAAIFIPQFAMSGGWATQFALINNSTATAKGWIDIFDQSGSPRPVTLNGVTQSTFSYAIPAGGVFTLAPRDANGQSPF